MFMTNISADIKKESISKKAAQLQKHYMIEFTEDEVYYRSTSASLCIEDDAQNFHLVSLHKNFPV